MNTFFRDKTKLLILSPKIIQNQLKMLILYYSIIGSGNRAAKFDTEEILGTRILLSWAKRDKLYLKQIVTILNKFSLKEKNEAQRRYHLWLKIMCLWWGGCEMKNGNILCIFSNFKLN